MKKKLTTLVTCLALSACGATAKPPCHLWTADEIAELQAEDRALAPDATLHALIKNYENICTQ